MWKQINPYYLEQNGWTISKMTLANGTRYGLWEGSVNKGFFDTSDEAKKVYEELTK
jgi:hypothetical protein